MTDKKCPKCGSRNFRIADYYVVNYLYEVKDGVVSSEGGGEDFDQHVKTKCTCSQCGYSWHPRNFDYEIDN